MTDANVIDLLGGATHLAPALERSVSAVQNWKVRGIPWRFRLQVANIAKRKKIALPDTFLTRGE